MGESKNRDESMLPAIVDLLREMIRSGDRRHEAILGELRGVNQRLDTLTAEMRDMRRDIVQLQKHEARLARLEEAVFKKTGS